MGSIGVVDSGLIELVGEVRGESAGLCRFLAGRLDVAGSEDVAF
jgi:hypothetical protein